MLTIYFFYGLAFIVLSAVIFLMPRREDCIGLDKSMIFVGWFAILHGLNEWVDLLIIAGGPFNAKVLSITAGILLPLSYIPLLIFGCVVISGIKTSFKWLKAAWISLPMLWAGLSILAADPDISGILARYILCVPGTVLTSLAVYLSLRRCDRYVIPKLVRAGAWLSIISFLVYGVLSGMVTPKAHFFPASVINYPNFTAVFHLPVQFFRMACALMISCGLILISGAFFGRKPSQPAVGTIKQKLTLIITLSVVIVTIVGVVLTYFAGSAIFTNILGNEYSQIARTLNIYTVDTLDGEVLDAKSYATRPLWKDLIAEANSRYEGMDAEAIKRKLLDKDRVWIDAKPGDPIFREYMENRVSMSMVDVQKTRREIAELFITDKYGGLVAASEKTSDFYQADEEWWQGAYNDGKGSIYVGDIEFDESSKKWVISIAVPIKNSEEEVIGIYKNSIGIGTLFEGLADFKLGKTGHAALIDNNGVILFHHSVLPMIEKVFPMEQLRKVLNAGRTYTELRGTMLHEGRMFVAFNEIRPPYLSDRGMSWIVMIHQDMSEVSVPVHNFIAQILIIMLLMMVLIIPVGSFFGKLISDPIHDLHLATEKIMAGDWDYKIDVKTGDEIEQFAYTFRDMIADIKSKQSELKDFSNSLEAKVEERTKELNVAQEATLNILEDLQHSKEDLERMNKDLLKLDQLKSDFISTVSHELRTPLSIIKEGISLVLDRIPGDVNEKQSKILDISKYNIDRLARIIDGLLDLSKIEAGKMELKRNLIDISDLARQVANSFEIKVKDKGLEMRLDIDPAIGTVWADADRITQVLTNLVGNAVKFTDSGYIEISCKDKGDAVACSVSDTGVGIAKEDLPKVFDKFQQFGRTAGAGDKGTGLGLSIAKRIIDMHNGTMWVESGFQKGSKFTFKLHKYTPQSLFAENVSRGIKKAEDKGAKMSVITIALSLTGNDASGVINKRFSDIMQESAKLVKSTLRRAGDDVISSGSEMVVVLTDCDKDSSARVQYRIEEMINKYLAGQDAAGAVKVKYGYATYPDDAKGGMELIDKAKSALDNLSNA